MYPYSLRGINANRTHSGLSHILRLDLPPDPQWQKVIGNLAPPSVRTDIYPAMEIPAETSPSTMTTFMYGVLPGKGIDVDAMRNTLHLVAHTNAPQNAVTWGTPMLAMCAARLNEPHTAVALLVGNYDQNPFRVSGYTVRRPDQTPMYIARKRRLALCVAMMAPGWEGATTHAPGFPKDWKVRYEGLQPLPDNAVVILRGANNPVSCEWRCRDVGPC